MSRAVFTLIFKSAFSGKAVAEEVLGHTGLTVYRIIVCAIIPIGDMVAVLPTVWELADFCDALMIPLNLVVLLGFSGLVVKVMKGYVPKIFHT